MNDIVRAGVLCVCAAAAIGTAACGRVAEQGAGCDRRRTPTPGADEASSLAIFDRRILPILQAKDPSSCSECHLSGVDLKQYIRPDANPTFASLGIRG